MKFIRWAKNWIDAYRAYRRGDDPMQCLYDSIPPEQCYDGWDGIMPGEDRPHP